MEESRERLRRQVYLAYSDHAYEGRTLCPWCNNPISGIGDLHEWLIKRNAVSPPKQHLIMTVENCILVHRGCHNQHGQTKLFRIECLSHAARHIGATKIGEWYHDLAYGELLSLPKGILAPRGKETPTSMAMKFLNMGAHAADVTLPANWQGHAATGQAIMSWRGKRADNIPLNGLSQEYLIVLLEHGRWISYLQAVCQ